MTADHELVGIWAEVERLARTLKQKNAINGGIRTLGQRHARQALDLLKGKEPSAGTYGRRGEVQSQPPAQRLTKA